MSFMLQLQIKKRPHESVNAMKYAADELDASASRYPSADQRRYPDVVPE